MSTRKVPARRDFLRATVWGGSCLAFGLAAARRQAEASGKPVFTEASFNQMMREAQASGQIKQMAGDASRDLKGWLQRSFTLTPAQVKRIQSMPPESVQQIAQTLVPISQKGGTIQISMTEQRQPAAQTKKEQELKKKEAEAGDAGFGKKLISVATKPAGAAEKRVQVTLADRAAATPAQQPATSQPR